MLQRQQVKLSLQQENLSGGQTIAASSFIASAVELGPKPITEFAFYDVGQAGGHFSLNGVAQADGQWVAVTPAQLGQLTYSAGTAGGSETIYVAAWDGRWTTASTSVVTTVPTPSLPTVVAANQTLSEGQSIAAGSLIASTLDPNNKAITQYSLTDSGTDGHLVYNGTVLAANQAYTFTAAQLANVSFVAGSAVGTDTISIKVSDGGAFSAASTATISVQGPVSPLAKLQDAGVAADVGHLMSNGSLSYGSMLTILQDAAATAMTATKFATLQTLASLLNASNGIATSAYVQQITDDVVDGNAANAYWNGGANTATVLGNLSASATQTQFNELIGKWFLGTDLPSLAGTGLAATYQASTLPLFGSNGVPSNADVNQGYLGDCYLMSALGETALRDPSAIMSMITDNGNGTDAVRFYVNGVADYVTVNNALPVMSGNYSWANKSTLEFANGPVNWVALIEKAYVQLNEQFSGSATPGSAYENISGGYASTLTQITNQAVKSVWLAPTTSAATLAKDLSTLIADWKAGNLMMLSTPSADSGNLVGDHMFQITGIDAATGVISILNPWNTAYQGPLQMAFTETIQQLAADSAVLYDSPAAGASVAAHTTVATGHGDLLLH